jgi:hypothetical protein
MLTSIAVGALKNISGTQIYVGYVSKDKPKEIEFKRLIKCKDYDQPLNVPEVTKKRGRPKKDEAVKVEPTPIRTHKFEVVRAETKDGSMIWSDGLLVR